MKTPENKGSDSESSRNGTIQNVASDDEFIDALEDLVKTLRNGSLNHASFSAVHFSREVPEGDSSSVDPVFEDSFSAMFASI